MRYRYERMPDAVKRIAIWQLENYHADKRMLEAAKREMIAIPVQTYGGKVSTQHNDRRPTEQTAIRILSEPFIHRVETNLKAVDAVLSHLDPVDLRLIELLYWRQGQTVTSAGMAVYLEKTAIYQRLNRIIGSVAVSMGYLS